MEDELCDNTGNKRSHRNRHKTYKEDLGSHTVKAFNRFTTHDSHTGNITHNKESDAVSNLKAER